MNLAVTNVPPQGFYSSDAETRASTGGRVEKEAIFKGNRRTWETRVNGVHGALTEQLQRIQHHRVRLNGGEPMAEVLTISSAQNEVLHALGIEEPASPEQLALL